MPGFERPGDGTGAETRQDFRWLMSSDVCKHCTHAGCLDVCPTGALFRTEFGTVVVQQDICNGCGYCVSGCPYGVIDRREDDGRAWKCTLCYDRLHDGLEPACGRRVRRTRSSSVRWTSCASGRRGGWRSCMLAGCPRLGCMATTRTTGWAVTALLPAARRARGVRAATGPGGADAGCGGDVEVRGDGGVSVGRCRGLGVHGAALMIRGIPRDVRAGDASSWRCHRRSSGRTTGGRS